MNTLQAIVDHAKAKAQAKVNPNFAQYHMRLQIEAIKIGAPPYAYAEALDQLLKLEEELFKLEPIVV